MKRGEERERQSGRGQIVYQTAGSLQEKESHGGCQKVGPKVAKFLDR